MGLTAVVLALGLLLQVSSGSLRTVGAPLDAKDLVTVSELAATPAGGKPWLIVAATSQVRGMLEASAYGPARNTTANVRRGVVVRLTGTDVPGRGRYWSVYDSRSYAQVPLEGREAQDVRDEADPNLPFVVGDGISDDELVEIVRFVRTSPSGSDRRPTRIDNDRHPIEAIARFRRAAGTDVHQGIRVSFRIENLYTRWLDLERNGSTWFVAHVGEMIA